jgi:hypothetical protein
MKAEDETGCGEDETASRCIGVSAKWTIGNRAGRKVADQIT